MINVRYLFHYPSSPLVFGGFWKKQRLVFCAQVDKILKVIPRDRRTFLFSATMTKKVDVVSVLSCIFCSLALLFDKKANGAFNAYFTFMLTCVCTWVFFLITGPETTESSPERPCKVCSLKQIFHGRQTSAVLHFHTIKVQGMLHCYMF